MSSISRVTDLFNVGLQVRALAAAFLVTVAQLGWTNARERRYRMEFQHREYVLTAEVVVQNGEPCVRWPSCKAPRRRYPVAAYLYGAARYLCSDLSQREVAAEVRRLFGLSRFSHSTLCRVIGQLRKRVDLLESCLGLAPDKGRVVVRRRWRDDVTAALKRLGSLLSGLLLANVEAIMAASHRLVHRFFLESGGHFII